MPNPYAPNSDETFGPVADYYDLLMSGVPYAFWVDYVERVWQRHDLRPYTVLDLACGTGTVSRLMTRRAYDVTGVDLSSPMLAVARRRAVEEGLAIPFFHQDAADLSLTPRQFDAAVCLFDSLNYILDPGRLAQTYVRVFQHLAPGGSFLFDLNTEYALEQGMFNQSCARKDEPLHYRWRSSYDSESRVCTVRMRFSYEGSDGERRSFSEVHRQRAYHKEEILQWLREAGFIQTFVYDAYSFEPAKRRSDRLFFLGIKPRIDG
jgi:SAM-dependent methyltransferase